MQQKKKSIIKTRIVKGPFGPHAAKKEFYFKGKWHFLKWVSKAQHTVKRSRSKAK